MRNTLTILALAATLTLGTSACTNEQSGQVIGGILGGAAGSQVGSGRGRTVATVVGAIAGGYIGGNIGRSMDETDRLKAQHSLENNRTNESSNWHNPDTGNDYTVTPTRTYQSDSGRYCREYTTEVMVGGKREEAYGTACRQPDGAWQVVS
jgi:surface antigen